MSLVSRTGTGTQPKQADQELRGRILRKLAKSPYYAIRKISCDVAGEILTLRGRVPSYFLKQVAQSLILEIARKPVVIKNRIVVTESRAGKKR